MSVLATALLTTVVPKIIEGVLANSARGDYIDSLSGIKLEEPESLKRATGLFSNMAGQGMPGYGKYQDDIMGSIPQTLESLKEVAGNPAAILGGLNDAQSSVTNALSNLAVKDAMFKLENNQQLANFLGTTKAGFDTEAQKYKNDVLLAKAKEKMLGTKDMLAGITGGISGGLSAYGNLSLAESYKSLPNAFQEFLKGGEGMNKTTGYREGFSPMLSMQPLTNTSVESNYFTPSRYVSAFAPSQPVVQNGSNALQDAGVSLYGYKEKATKDFMDAMMMLLPGFRK